MTRPAQLSKSLITGSAGVIEVAAQVPDAGLLRAVAVVAHPHPLFGGTMDNKVVTSMARAFVMGRALSRESISRGSWPEAGGC